MPLNSSCVGLGVTSGPLEVPARWLLACAAVLGLDEEQFSDDARPGGIVGAPFVCTRFEWMLLRQLRVHPALGLTPEETRRGLHFVQDSRFLAPLRPAMTVEAVGTVREVRPVKAGALVRYAYRLRDCASGADLVRTTSIGIFRDVAVPAGAKAVPGDEAPAGLPRSAVDSVGAELASIAVPRGFAHVYTECLDIWNPVHTERRTALAAGLPDIILHGTATWALAGCDLMRRYAGPTQRLTRLAGRFSGNVLLPSRLTLRHQAADGEPNAIRFDVLGPDGRPVLSDGEAAFGP